MRTLHRATLEQTEDGRWKAVIETLPECEVVADTQGEVLVALRKAAEAHVDFKAVTVRLKVPEEGIHIPKKLIEGVDEMDLIVQGDNRVIVTPVRDYGDTYKARDNKMGRRSFTKAQESSIDPDDEYPDPRYQRLIQKCINIEQPDAVERKLRAIQEAAKHEFPTADIEDMLREIDEGRGIS